MVQPWKLIDQVFVGKLEVMSRSRVGRSPTIDEAKLSWYIGLGLQPRSFNAWGTSWVGLLRSTVTAGGYQV